MNLFNHRGDLFYVLPWVILFLCFFSPFSIVITSLGEERANLSVFRMFVRFMHVWFCQFPLPLGVWEGLRFVNVAFPELFSYLFVYQLKVNNFPAFFNTVIGQAAIPWRLVCKLLESTCAYLWVRIASPPRTHTPCPLLPTFPFCYELCFMFSIAYENHANNIETFNSTPGYLDDLHAIDHEYF